jgi:hypothetical protein
LWNYIEKERGEMFLRFHRTCEEEEEVARKGIRPWLSAKLTPF